MNATNTPSATLANTTTDAYYRKLVRHAKISQCNTPLPQASPSIEDNGVWYNSGPEAVPMRTMFIDFQSLHHMNVVHLQDQLVKECNDMISSKTSTALQMQRVQTLLQDHSEAVRNWDAVVLRPIARNRFGPRETWRADTTYRFLSYWDSPMPTQMSFYLQRILTRKSTYELVRRLFMALVGGVAVVVPMLVMALNPSQEKSLITTCVAVVIFGFAIAFGSKAAAENVLGITAAYAAVLVVFVGTSSPTPSQS